MSARADPSASRDRTVRIPWALPVLTDAHLEALKWVAFGSMLIDHFGRYAFGLGTDSWAFAVGRLAFPLFALVLATNLARPGERTERAWRTSRRLAVWALISVIPSWWAREVWLPVNVLATLSIGAALCAVLDSRCSALIRGSAVAVGAAAGFFVEFSVPGVLLVLAIQRLQVNGTIPSLCLAAAMLALTAGLNMSFGGPGAAIWTFAVLGAVLAVRVGRFGLRRRKWAFYLAYPAHFVLVGALSRVLPL